MVGEKNYAVMRQLKYTWDPQNVFNPGKIIDTPPMDTMLRYAPDQKDPEIQTYFDFGPVSILQHAEQCNGTGECRKTHLSGGTMCPSYMATRHEKDTTRARANILREFLTHSTKPNRFNHQEIYEVMELCLLCKGCKSECPSNVDVAKLKMEFLQQYYDVNGAPFRSRLIGHFATLTALAARMPGLYNFLIKQSLTSGLFKRFAGFARQRSLPALHPFTLKQWWMKRTPPAIPPEKQRGKVYLFNDEFTNYQDVEAGIHTVLLLEALGYSVEIPVHVQSARALLSKGFLKKARTIAEKNIQLLEPIVDETHPLIGVEPSAILTFRDEYPDLTRGDMQQKARRLGQHALLIEEFLLREYQAGRITSDDFTDEARSILLHGHCQQKALVGIQPLKRVLSLPRNYRVTVIPSGCCGMAGSFGYEKEHYDLSMKIGDLVLFPSVRVVPQQTLIAAPGTSCRHQIKDGTGKTALHPATILWQAVKKVE
jgi:Fe-S oxidoreductase